MDIPQGATRIVLHFDSTDSRDSWLNSQFPNRRAKPSVPGMYSTEQGASLSVLREKVVVRPGEQNVRTVRDGDW